MYYCQQLFWEYEEVLSYLRPLIFIAYLGVGFLQLTAIMNGLQTWIGLHWFIATIVSTIFAYVPVVGSILGIFGAVYGWGWSWVWAIFLFCWPIIIAGMMMLGYATGSGVAALRRA